MNFYNINKYTTIYHKDITMSSISKTILCKYYLTGKCRFMKKSNMCLFAHGNSDLIKIECKYKQYCNNINCNYSHDVIYYNPPAFIHEPILKTICNKNKKNNNKKIFASIDSKDNIQVIPFSNNFKNVVNTIILNIKIKKFLKNKKIDSIKNIKNKNCDKCYNNKIKDIYNILKKYNLNTNLKELGYILNQYFLYNDLNKNKEKSNNLEIKNNPKTISSIEKYYILGKKIHEKLNDWKNIIKNDIHFINEKNIYKVKTRALRIVELINFKYKSINIYKNSFNNIPIRNIFNMNNNVFMNYIYNN